jgi:hypothetical protein
MDESFSPMRREVGRRRIPGTHKVEIVYAVRDPNFPTIEHFQRVVVLEKEESAKKTN